MLNFDQGICTNLPFSSALYGSSYRIGKPIMQVLDKYSIWTEGKKVLMDGIGVADDCSVPLRVSIWTSIREEPSIYFKADA